MERIQRALELARRQRFATASAVQTAAADHETVSTTGVDPAGRSRIPAAHTVSNDAATAARRFALDRDTMHGRRVVFPDDAGAAGHAYRMLRTQVLRRARQHDLRMIGVVSAIDGEGKTLTAVNLALSLAAEPNQTVLLADLDLHRPTLATLLGLPVTQGLDAWFTGDAQIGELFVGIEGIERLRVLPAVHAVAGSSEALAGMRARELLSELKSRYDDRLVLLDLPPVLLTDDVLTIAPMLDGVLIVVSEGRTRREDLAQVRELLTSVRIVGTVLNVSAESEQRAY